MLTRLHTTDGQTLEVRSSTMPYTQILFEAGLLQNTPLCAGAGRCGMCRIRFMDNPPEPTADDLHFFDPDELVDGWRLGCRHLTDQPREFFFPQQCGVSELPAVRGSNLVVDIGTTRIKWATGAHGVWSDEFALLNPQMGVGSEIMARLRHAQASAKGRVMMQDVLVAKLDELIRQTGATHICVTGNSTMIALLSKADPAPLATVPYSLPLSAGEEMQVHASLPRVYIPPLLAPFIGADISAGLAHICLERSPNYPFLLIDMGTNGEFVLALDQDHFLCTSVPMGPAIEGVGLTCGRMAGCNVISHFDVTPSGLKWELEQPEGISGTGYISLLAALRRLLLLDERGHFQSPGTPLASRIARLLEDGKDGRYLRLQGSIILAERDIEEFLKVKAGLALAIDALLAAAHLHPTALQHVYLAGALGEYAAARDFLELKFFPELWSRLIIPCGNTSLAGAKLLLNDDAAKQWVQELPEKTRVLSLVEQPDFTARYLSRMQF